MLMAESRRRQFKAGDVIVAENSIPQSLYWLAHGQAAIRLDNWRDHEVILGYVNAGGFFGEMGLFPDTVARTAMVVATRDCLVLELGYTRFRRLATEHDELWLELLGQMAERLRDANRRLVDTGLLRVPERLLEVVVKLAETNPIEVTSEGRSIRVTRQELGQLVGCTREVAGRALKQIESEGHVKLAGHTIVVRASAARAAHASERRDQPAATAP